MHKQAYDFVELSAAHFWRGSGRVLEIGSRNVNGSVRPLFPGAIYFGIDIVDGNEVDLVVDAKDYDGHGEYDICVTTEAMEHCLYPQEIINCAFRSLMSGGVFIATAASTGRGPHTIDGEQGHKDGEWYQNIEAAEMYDMLKTAGFTSIRSAFSGEYHDVQATAVKP